MASPTYSAPDKAALTGSQQTGRITFEILAKKEGAEKWLWCDFNKPFGRSPETAAQPTDPFFRRLIEGSEPIIRKEMEALTGRFMSGGFSVELNDQDRAFGASYPWEVWGKVNDASPYETAIIETLDRAIVRIRQAHNVDSPDTMQYETLGVFVISEVKRSSKTRTLKLKLAGPETILKDCLASNIKRGDTWPINAHVSMLVNALIEATPERITWDSSALPNPLTAEVDEEVIAPYGNIPHVNPDGTWNEDNDFIVRHISKSDAGIYYFGGYSILWNRPAYARWDPSDNSWVYQINDDVLAGYQCIHIRYDETNAKVWAFCVGCATCEEDAHTYNQRGNHILWGVRLNATTLAFIGRDRHGIFLMGQYPTAPWVSEILGLRPSWGGHSGLESIPVAFDQQPFSQWVDRDDAFSDRGLTWRTEEDESGADILSQSNDIMKHASGGENTLAHPMFAHRANKGYACCYSDTERPVKFPHGPISTWLHGAIHESIKYDPIHKSVHWIHWSKRNEVYRFRLASFKLENDNFSSQVYSDQIIDFGRFDTTAPSDWRRIYNAWVTAFEIYHDTHGGVGRAWFGGMHNRNPEVLGFAEWEETFLIESDLPQPWNLMTMTAELSAYFDSPCFDRSVSRPSKQGRYHPVIHSINFTNFGNPSWDGALYGGVCNYAAIAGPCYGLFWIKFPIPTIRHGVFAERGCLTGKRWPSSTMPFAFSNPDPESYTTGGRGEFLAQDQATGKLWRLAPWAGSTGRRELLADGDPADAESTWCSCNILWDDDRIMGVSAPGPPCETQIYHREQGIWTNYYGVCNPPLSYNSVPGRYAHWVYGTVVPGVVPLGDFGEDNDVWDGLEMLRQICGDYLLYIKDDVDDENRLVVVLKPRSTDPPSQYIIDKSKEGMTAQGTGVGAEPTLDIAALYFDSEIDNKGIVNIMEPPIYTAERATPEVDVFIQPRTDNEVPACTVSAIQYSNTAQRVVLRCIRPGRVATDLDTDEYKVMPLMFAFSQAFADIRASLKAPAFPSTDAVSVYGYTATIVGNEVIHRIGDREIAAGDFLQVMGCEQVEIINIHYSNLITLANPIGGPDESPIGTVVTITPRQGVRFSDAIDVAYRVDEEDWAITPGAGSKSLRVAPNTRGLTPGMVLFADTGMVVVSSVVDNQNIRVRLDNSLGCGAGMAISGSTMSWPWSTKLKSAIWIRNAGRSYAIGNTGVAISIMGRADGTANTGLFREGDRITISCSGLVSKANKSHVVREINQASYDLHGPKRWKPAVENRLMTPVRARVLVAANSSLAEARELVVVEGIPMLTSVKLGAVYYVQSDYLWPDAASAIPCEVVGHERNSALREMSMKLRTLEAAPSEAKEAEGDQERSTGVGADPFDPFGRRR